MIRIPAGDFRFQVEGIEIEGFDDVGVDVQYPWENTPRRFHDHPVHVSSFWIDKYPVTNAQFSTHGGQFCEAGVTISRRDRSGIFPKLTN